MGLRLRPRRADTTAAARDYYRADARRLALELGHLAPRSPVPVMQLGVVLEPGEEACRATYTWVRVLEDWGWPHAALCECLITDRRLLLRMPGGQLACIWWAGLVGLDIRLDQASVVLDFGDHRPRQLAGEGVDLIAVAAVAAAYGVEALISHPALDPLRHAPA